MGSENHSEVNVIFHKGNIFIDGFFCFDDGCGDLADEFARVAYATGLPIDAMKTDKLAVHDSALASNDALLASLVWNGLIIAANKADEDPTFCRKVVSDALGASIEKCRQWIEESKDQLEFERFKRRKRGLDNDFLSAALDSYDEQAIAEQENRLKELIKGKEVAQ